MNVDFKVRSFERRWLDLFWDFQDVETFGYEWRVGRSESPEGPWDWLSPWVREVFSMRDNIGSHFSRAREFFYVLEVRKRGTSEATSFKSALRARPDLVGMEMILQVRMELRHGSGRAVFYVPKRTYGTRCSSCFDRETNTRIRSNCEACYDTGFAGGGYLSPIRTEADIREVDKNVVLTDYGKTVQADCSCRMSNYPPIKEGGLIITSENDRYRIEKLTNSSHKGSPYEQNLYLHLIPRGDAEYRIPIDVGALEEYEDLLDERTRTYPTDHDVEEVTTNSLLGVFGRLDK